MYLANGDIEKATQRATAATKANRHLASARALQGDIFSRQERYEEALACYHRALSYQPHYPRVQLASANIYRRLGRPQRALGTMQWLADRYPPGDAPRDVMHMQGLALHDLGRFEDATACLTQARLRGPANADLLFDLSVAQLAAGRPTDARLTLDEALAMDPSHAAGQQLKAQIDGERQRVAALDSRGATAEISP